MASIYQAPFRSSTQIPKPLSVRWPEYVNSRFPISLYIVQVRSFRIIANTTMTSTLSCSSISSAARPFGAFSTRNQAQPTSHASDSTVRHYLLPAIRWISFPECESLKEYSLPNLRFRNEPQRYRLSASSPAAETVNYIRSHQVTSWWRSLVSIRAKSDTGTCGGSDFIIRHLVEGFKYLSFLGIRYSTTVITHIYLISRISCHEFQIDTRTAYFIALPIRFTQYLYLTFPDRPLIPVPARAESIPVQFPFNSAGLVNWLYTSFTISLISQLTRFSCKAPFSIFWSRAADW